LSGAGIAAIRASHCRRSVRAGTERQARAPKTIRTTSVHLAVRWLEFDREKAMHRIAAATGIAVLAGIASPAQALIGLNHVAREVQCRGIARAT
jgi:hypothetical protein